MPPRSAAADAQVSSSSAVQQSSGARPRSRVVIRSRPIEYIDDSDDDEVAVISQRATQVVPSTSRQVESPLSIPDYSPTVPRPFALRPSNLRTEARADREVPQQRDAPVGRQGTSQSVLELSRNPLAEIIDGQVCNSLTG